MGFLIVPLQIQHIYFELFNEVGRHPDQPPFLPSLIVIAQVIGGSMGVIAVLILIRTYLKPRFRRPSRTRPLVMGIVGFIALISVYGGVSTFEIVTMTLVTFCALHLVYLNRTYLFGDR